VRHKEPLAGGIAFVRQRPAKAVNNTPRIGINNKDRPGGGIEYYRIGRLRPNSVDGKHLTAHLSDIKGKQLIKIITVSATQPVGQGLELFCFCIKVTTVVDYQRQLRHGHTAYRCRG
jgi:hypothetical protein